MTHLKLSELEQQMSSQAPLGNRALDCWSPPVMNTLARLGTNRTVGLPRDEHFDPAGGQRTRTVGLPRDEHFDPAGGQRTRTVGLPRDEHFGPAGGQRTRTVGPP